MIEEVEEIDSDSKQEGLVSWTGLVPHGGNAIQIQGRMTGPTRRSTKGGWTEEEDKILADAVKKYNCKNWKKIAECVPDRTDVQCLHRWQKVLNPDLVKGPWKKEEDDLIRKLVEKHGNKKWSEIAKHLPGRIGKQCRERWHNHLNPDINRTPWTIEEEAILIKNHATYGNRWAEIAKFLHGRTENSIKNHWNCSVRKKLESCPTRGFDLYSFRTKTERRMSEVDKVTNDKRMSMLASMDSLDLVLGNVVRTEGRQLPTSDKKYCKEWNDSTKSKCSRTIDARASATSSLSNEDCRENESSGYTTEFSGYFSNNLPFGSLHKTPYSWERTHEPANSIDLSLSINPLPFKAISPSLDLCLSTPFSAPPCDEKADELHEKNKEAEAPEIVDEFHRGLLCYESLQLKDLNIFLETGSLPSTDSYIRTAGSPSSFFTHKSSSPESRLRNAARSFKNRPSIIRKRSCTTSREAGNNTGYNTGVLTPKDSKDKSNSGNVSLHSCLSDKDEVDNVDLLNKNQLFLSPRKSQKLEASAAMKSVEKRLEYAFSIEG